MQSLQVAYWINIVVLVPIAIPTVFRLFPTDEARFEESAGWRVLVGSLWSSILVLSILGLFQPLLYSPLLVLQLIYKSVWLAVYILPRLLRSQSSEVPWGISISFAFIVIVWPFIIPWSYLLRFG